MAIVRGSITQKDSWLDLLSQLEKAGVSCINNRSCVNLCADKYRSYLRLADYGLVQPHTVLIPNKKGVETAFESKWFEETHPHSSWRLQRFQICSLW